MNLYLLVFLIVVVASVVVGLAVAGLDRLAHRTHRSRDAGPPVDPVRHTEAERVAALAELDPDAVALQNALDRMEARLRTRARIFDRRVEAHIAAFAGEDWRSQPLVHDFVELRELVLA